MLRQASVADVAAARVRRDLGHVVVVMRIYPRFLRKELRDEYVPELAPDRTLFGEFKSAERETGDHDAAFAACRYEERFRPGRLGMQELERLSKLARDRDVFLICQCEVGQRCHRELLLILAAHHFDAPAEPPRQDYPVFRGQLR